MGQSKVGGSRCCTSRSRSSTTRRKGRRRGQFGHSDCRKIKAIWGWKKWKTPIVRVDIVANTKHSRVVVQLDAVPHAPLPDCCCIVESAREWLGGWTMSGSSAERRWSSMAARTQRRRHSWSCSTSDEGGEKLPRKRDVYQVSFDRESGMGMHHSTFHKRSNKGII